MSKEKENKGKKKSKGVISILIGLLFVILGVALAATRFLTVDLPPVITNLTAAIALNAGIMSDIISPGILLVILALIIFTSRVKRPFNYIFLPIAVAVYFTLLAGVHLVMGNPNPAFLMSRLQGTSSSLVLILFVLEILVCFVISLVTIPINRAYRLHCEKKSVENVKLDLKAQKKAAKKAGKKAKKGIKTEEEFQNEGEEKLGDEAVHVSASTRPDTNIDFSSPLDFPQTIKVPDFSTIPRGTAPRQSVYEEAQSDSSAAEERVRPEKDFNAYPGGENVVSMSVLEQSARRIQDESQINKTVSQKPRLFRHGSMLESALESTRLEQENGTRPVQPINQSPIIGYEDKRKKAEENRRDTNTSFAPSSLSPNHPRYKLFESLKRKNEEDQSPSVTQGEEEVTHFPSRGFTTERPMSGDEKEPVISLRNQSTLQSEKHIVQHQEKPVIPSAPIMQSESEPEIVEEPLFEPEPVKIEPTPAPAVKMTPSPARKPLSVKEEVIGEEEILVDDNEEGHNNSQIELQVGVSGLVSNNGGEAAIIKRQKKRYTPPSPNLLADYPAATYEVGESEYNTANVIISVLHDFRVEVELAGIVKGPTITLYEFTLAPGVLVSKVENLEKNIAMRIGGLRIRILAPVPGTSAVGIEVPNTKRATVGFKELLKPLKEANLHVPMILGRDIQGSPKTIDVAKCPHLLIAGTTGSGKSVCINGLIASILYTKSPKEVRLIMVDPKVVELSVYNGIPHLLTPVITEPKRVLKMLSWLVEEMERRYKVFSQVGVRNIENFNSRIHEFGMATEKMPYIVLIMDEFADLMTVIGKDIDEYVRRIMAKARAAGIHVVMATQRPSSEVVTGTIKNNIPTRIAFAASSGINSRIVLDEGGAENLLGKGDMLLSTQTSNGLVRIQGAFLSDDEVEAIVHYVKSQGEPDYLDEAIFEDEPEPEVMDFGDDDGGDGDAELYEKAKQICFERKGASASYLQRRLSIGYNRAARLVEQMEDEGIVGPANGSKPREILRYE